ncbi:patatin-like phospholipase family protein [Mariniblastus sp.]|nr:patatin-like phospholipase family protein [Mariniblastus sp.]
MPNENPTNQFLEEVFPAELEEVRRRRSEVGDPREIPAEAAEHGPSVDNELFGLALSGGGIRSASFSLGVVQGLIKTGLFNSVDYLSTVSGGGYTGACISSLTHRGRNGERLIVDHAGEIEPPALNHLRNGSNFLVSGAGST